MRYIKLLNVRIPGLLFLMLLLLGHAQTLFAEPTHTQVLIPGEDRFSPFSVVVHPGDTVDWTNNDNGSHAITSDTPFDINGHKHVDRVLQPGETTSIVFKHPGVFVYYCRFHAALDAQNQPVENGLGLNGTTMMGIVTVLP